MNKYTEGNVRDIKKFRTARGLGSTYKITDVPGWDAKDLVQKFNSGEWVEVVDDTIYSIAGMRIAKKITNKIVLEDWVTNVIELIPGDTIVDIKTPSGNASTTVESIRKEALKLAV
jgi:hypothetical protein